ncbi:hypothetical protein K7X08_003252 [Anisodus acutangulus]|uniref:Peptide N-acetyl-beta-D-glucosaminyl asparaginase amidase A N-terminal domain-containing protein n=1 Tax=Anisodus acutangulus TaxID=402998 RepID=A0A9Q1MIH1_9SOLA|nr:hypothetical protein K7X08_003252 [Anisodus acutangulus]
MANILLFFFLIISFTNAPLSSSLDHHSHLPQNTPSREYSEITGPLPFSNLTPSCTLPILKHNFGNTIGLPPVSISYAPPANCSWTHVSLQFNASCKGVQYDRIAAVWLDGAELFRTSTVEPTDNGVFWTVTKDVTRYSSLLVKKNISLSVMLENLVNYVYTGIYHVNVTFVYYDIDNMINVPLSSSTNRKVRLVDDVFVDKPADLIIPISGNEGKGFWFRIENDSELHGKSVVIPKNTYKAVMEIYVSSHGYDEFWYSNPPDSYIRINNLSSQRGHGAYREVLLNIDENLVGSVVPFPVISPGGINPQYWDPIVSIGAFDHPSYDIELTPFLEFLLDGKSHFLRLGVVDSLPFWLVDANLHLWVDTKCTSDCEVQAKVLDFGTPEFEMERSSDFEGLDGSYEIEMKRKSKYSGWVKSSAGKLTTTVSREVKFKNKIKFHENGNEKKVKQKVKEEIEIEVESETGTNTSHTKVKRKFPLTITTKTKSSREDGTNLMLSELEHEWKEKKKWSARDSDSFSSSLKNEQKCKGWMVVQDHIVLQGGATTEQSYSYKGEASSYSREITAVNGKLMNDTANYIKFASFSAM